MNSAVNHASGATLRRREPRPDAAEAGQQETLRLAALIAECVTAGIARRACILHLSHLPPDRLRPHHLRMAKSALEPLANADRARLFELPTTDIVVVWRGEAEAALSASRTAILQLFDQEERSPAEARQSARSPLWENLILPQDAGRLLTLTETILNRTEQLPLPPPPAPPLDITALATFEARLSRADVARFARRRQICARLPDGSFRLRWEKRYLSISELSASLDPEHSARADPWLFRRLTRTLDRRMLALLAAQSELNGAGPFALNLNVSSVLSSEFLRFDEAVPQILRGQVMIDVLPDDLLADPAAFLFARDFAQARGYRITLRSMTTDLLPVFSFKQIGVDFMRLRWSADLATHNLGELRAHAGSLVLTDTDTPQALLWGGANGITLFSGRAVAQAGARPLHGGMM